PVLDPANRSAAFGDDALETFNELIDLLLRQILPGKKHMFVKSHCLAFLRFSPGSRRLKPLQLLLTRRFPGKGAGKKGAWTRRSRAETREAEALPASCRRLRKTHGPPFSPQSGPAD